LASHCEGDEVDEAGAIGLEGSAETALVSDGERRSEGRLARRPKDIRTTRCQRVQNVNKNSIGRTNNDQGKKKRIDTGVTKERELIDGKQRNVNMKGRRDRTMWMSDTNPKQK